MYHFHFSEYSIDNIYILIKQCKIFCVSAHHIISYIFTCIKFNVHGVHC